MRRIRRALVWLAVGAITLVAGFWVFACVYWAIWYAAHRRDDTGEPWGVGERFAAVTLLVVFAAVAIAAWIRIVRRVWGRRRDRPRTPEGVDGRKRRWHNRRVTGRAVVIALAVIAVAVAAFRSFGDGGIGLPGRGGSDTIHVQWAYSSNLEDLVTPLIEEFNDGDTKVDGHDVEVAGLPVSSGEAHQKIVARELRPVVWSPASSLWGRLLDFDVDAKWAPDDSTPLVRTPLVVAIWKPAAEALGWPKRELGFAEIRDLATSRRGWSAYGLPTFGDFKLGHTNPDFSTSGLSFVAAQYFTAAGKIEGLTEVDVKWPQVRQRVRELEQAIVHYGDTGSFFTEQMKLHGPGYVSAVAMEEVTLLEYNRERRRGSFPLVAIYPREGSFDFDNPLIVLDAPWVTRPQKRAGTAFAEWISRRITPGRAAKYGYRPGNPTIGSRAPIDRRHFVDPRQPRRRLTLPAPRVLAAIRQAWHEDRKAANVAVVVDVSGSMTDGGKLDQARAGLKVFLRAFGPRDRVSLLSFADSVTQITPVVPVGPNRARLLHQVDLLTASGGTAVYDATARAVETIAALDDHTRINAVVVLTDGEDTASTLEREALIRALRARAESQERNIRVFTIAYGSDANADVLDEIAAAAGGESYEGDPDDIDEVYQQISSYF